jgi:tRNA A37 threonylcarbamoyltransferase TsaD
VTREHLDLRLGELATRLEAKIAELRSETLKWMFGAVGLQTLAILGGVAALLRLFGR